jgi:hypothetical protein
MARPAAIAAIVAASIGLAACAGEEPTPGPDAASTPPSAAPAPAAAPTPAEVASALVRDDRNDRQYVLAGDTATSVRILDLAGAPVATLELPGVFEHARADGLIAPDGISHDGGTLVLERPAAERTDGRTKFAIVDTRLASAPKVVELQGAFDYDALSPDGRILYLTQRVDLTRTAARPSDVAPDDAIEYVVRPYDLATGILGPVIADKLGRDVVEPMVGGAQARVIDPTGEWAYTVYDGGPHAFVHALNLANGFALCIDIPEDVHTAPTPGAWSLTLAGARLEATNRVDGVVYELDLADIGRITVTARPI